MLALCIGLIGINLHHANTAREQAMKHLGLYLEDNKQKSPLEGVSRETMKLIAEKLSGKR